MAKITLDSNYWLFIRKDIMACTFLTLQARLVLSSILSRQKNEVLKTHIEKMHSFFGITEQETDFAFRELQDNGLIESLELNNKTYTCTLNREEINRHFSGSIYCATPIL